MMHITREPLFPFFIRNLICTPCSYLTNVSDLAELPCDIWLKAVLLQYIAFMGYSALVWDHCITFGVEINYIWKKFAASKGVSFKSESNTQNASTCILTSRLAEIVLCLFLFVRSFPNALLFLAAYSLYA